MDCERYRVMISKKLDGELGQEEQVELERHLAQCSDCSRFYELASEMVTAHKAMPEVEPSPVLLPSIISATTAREDEGFSLSRWLRVAVTAASIATVLLGFVVGERLAKLYIAPENNTVAIEETLGLDYLSDSPPGSVGYALIASSGGGQNE